jgi:pyridoxine kinase
MVSAASAFRVMAVNILSIQSHVAYGHVGNSAAVFALQRLGVAVWPIHTVQFSNHTGYDTWRGRAMDAGSIRELVQGLRERGALVRCDAVLSGYVGSVDIGTAILDAVGEVRRANPKALYCCDPVIGDAGRGAFVAPEVADFMRRHAVRAADIVTPNHFELDRLAGRTTRSLAEVLAAVTTVRALGPRVVLVTSLATDETPPGEIELLASDDSGSCRLRTLRLPVAAHGVGDLIAALFLAHYLRSGATADALARAAAATFGVLKRTAEAGASEMLLVEAQDELVNPTDSFRPEPL